MLYINVLQIIGRKIGEAAFRTVKRNFYVDDLLKSKSTEEKAAKLAVAVERMCKSGGFNLTKFISPAQNYSSNFLQRKD